MIVDPYPLLVSTSSKGDVADWLLMIFSTLVFVLVAMQLYRIYVLFSFPHLLH
jgi:hypothetical protein